MTTYYYLGAETLTIPGDGTRPADTIDVGGSVDADTNPLPIMFSEDQADVRDWTAEEQQPAAVAAEGVTTDAEG